MDVSTVPPEPNGTAPTDPNYYQPTPYVRYDEVGRIIATGTQALGTIREQLAAGMRLTFGAFGGQDHYVDTSGPAPVVKPRPQPDWAFDHTEVLPRQETVMKDLPPATVRFNGPSEGTQPHDKQGDLAIGWTVPGDYTVMIEAFPYKPITRTLKVIGRVASAQANAGAKL